MEFHEALERKLRRNMRESKVGVMVVRSGRGVGVLAVKRRRISNEEENVGSEA